MKRAVLAIFVLLAFGSECLSALPFHGADNRPEGILDVPNNITDVALMGDRDHREPISKAYKKLGLSDEEYHQALTSTGVINCKSSDGKTYSSGGVLAEAKDILLTNSHIFYNHDGDPENNCYFLTYAHPDLTYPISAASTEVTLGSPSAALQIPDGDYAVVHLKKDVKDASPYHLDWNGTSLEVGDKLISILSTHNSHSPKLIGSEPKIQSCSVLQTYHLDPQGRNAYKTTCDALDGDSASLNLTRTADGKFVLRGLLVGDAPGTTEHCTPNKDDCASVSVQLVGPALIAVKRLMALSGQP